MTVVSGRIEIGSYSCQNVNMVDGYELETAYRSLTFRIYLNSHFPHCPFMTTTPRST